MNEDKTIECTLVSYPRSGQTWLRYCFEVITDLSVYGNIPLTDELNYNLSVVKKNINYFKLATTHNFYASQEKHKSNKLILLLRNYKECIRRHREDNYFDDLISKKYCIKEEPSYLMNLKLFDECNLEKIYIYYEDLIVYPKETLIKVFNFMNIKTYDIDNFMKNYKIHKNKSVSKYKDIFKKENQTTNGDKLLYYSLGKEKENKLMEDYLKFYFPKLYNKFLKVYDENSYAWKNKIIFKGE